MNPSLRRRLLARSALVHARSPLALDALASVLLPLDRARALPAQAYTDEEVFAFERRALLGASWTCVGRERDVEAPGAWRRAEIAGDEVVVLRGDDLDLRAFYNVCRHRGAPLATEAAGRCRQLVCPYHGWTYSKAGHLLDAPHTNEGFDRASFGLISLRLATWQGFVFVTADEAAPSLETAMGEVPPWLVSTDLRHLRRGGEARWETAANWKLLVANFQESHHFTRVHPSLERLTPTARATSHLGEGPWLGGVMAIERDTVSTSGTLLGRPRLVADTTPRVYDALLFPTWLTSLQPDYFLAYRLEPRGAARTGVAFDVFFHPQAKDAALADVLGFWETVNAEDRAICEAQQRGIASAGFVPGPYTRADEGVHAFEQRVARRHLA